MVFIHATIALGVFSLAEVVVGAVLGYIRGCWSRYFGSPLHDNGYTGEVSSMLTILAFGGVQDFL